jgi:3-oxoadipate enol-lactonase
MKLTKPEHIGALQLIPGVRRTIGGRMTKRLAALALVSSLTGAAAAVPGTAGDQASSSSGVRSGYAEVPGGRLWFEVAGSGDALVLIHGNAGDRRHWDHQFLPLARGFQVVRYDVRGYGKSTLPVEGEPYAAHEDLAALLDYLRISKAHIAGWSMGCGIAVDFALAYPERTTSLIAIGPWVSGYSSPAAQNLFADLGAVGAAASQSAHAAVDAWMRAPFFASTIRDSSAGAEFARIASDYSWWGFSHSNPQRALNPPAVGRLATIKAPTLVITAEHDIPACREVADLLARSVAEPHRVDLPGTGHLLHMEKPEEFNRIVTEFLRSQSIN